jgi:predicted nucleotidyltransferase
MAENDVKRPYPTPLLDEKLAQLRLWSEQDRQRLLQDALAWLQENAGQFGIEQGYLFGSVTQAGRFSQESDIDVAIESLNQGDPFGLSGFLSLHLNRDVDIVPLNQCHFASKIRQTGIAWKGNRLLD